MISDKARLNWLGKQKERARGCLWWGRKGFAAYDGKKEYWGKTPRQAIDKAMREKK